MKNLIVIDCLAFLLVVTFAVSAAKVFSSSNNVVDFSKILMKMNSLESKVAEMETLKRKVAEMEILKRNVAEMETLKRKVAEMETLKRKVAEMENDQETKEVSDMQILYNDVANIQSLKRKVAAIENEKATRNGICQIKNNPCGDTCICVEDYRLVNKYFCDCRSQTTQRDCKDHYRQGARINGLYTINNNMNGHNIQVFCDQTTDGGGWTIIQRRVDGSENFYRNWTEYKLGFGQLHREHWLGNDNIFYLTAQAFAGGSELRFDMLVKGQSTLKWAKYSSFTVNNEVSGYRLHVAGHSGTIPGGFKFTTHDRMKFTTYDRDNDQHQSSQCGVDSQGGWWYKNCNIVNLNGRYDRYEKEGSKNNVLRWYPYRLSFSEMKVRRK